MDYTSNHRFGRHQGIAVLFAIALLALQPIPTLAEENSHERIRLAGLIRQLDMFDRFTEQSASLPRQEHSRYHFDYARLRKDIARVRLGIRDYLTPQRAQPRDPVMLIGDYRREADQEIGEVVP